MSDKLNALTDGISGLEFAYTLTLAAILTGLVRARAPWEEISHLPIGSGSSVIALRDPYRTHQRAAACHWC